MIPASLVIARYFVAEQAAIEELEAEVAAIDQAMEEMAEDNSDEEGLLAAAKNDKDKLTKASVAARLKVIKDDADSADERKVLEHYRTLIETAATNSAQVTKAREALLAKVVAKYARLTEDEIKTLVVDDKWLAALDVAIHGEMDRISQTLAQRVKELAERYETPLPQMVRRVADLELVVNRHLEKMGFSWS